jgi:hypothetical protein
MWSSGSRIISSTVLKTGPLVAAASWMWTDEDSSVQCEQEANNKTDGRRSASFRSLRKQATLRQAVSDSSSSRQPPPPPPPPRRFNTKVELSKLRLGEQEMLRRWEGDEDGWRELPARAWPSYQPNPEQLKGIQAEVESLGCTNSEESQNTDLCKELLFNMATALVFYQLDPEAGFRQYEALAKEGHVNSMVACGVVLIEGMGVPPQEKKAIEWFQKAVAHNSAQGCYELGTVLYTGVDDVLEEDPEAAFELFKRAAEQEHTAAMYMMADCLVEGEGADTNVGQAVPLFYQAAEQGHRYSRQRIRELLAKQEYRD